MNTWIPWYRSHALYTVLIVCSLLVSSLVHACVNQEAPVILLKRLSSDVISTFNAQHDNIRNDPSIATKLIEDVLLPHVDFDYASEQVLLFEWEKLSPDQRTQFTQAFKIFLVRRSSIILASYMTEKDEKINENIFSFKEKSAIEDQTATVNSKFSGQNKDVGYKLHCNTSSWKIYDVAIDGVSTIETYQSQFHIKIKKDGFKGLLAFLNQANDLMLTLLKDKT